MEAFDTIAIDDIVMQEAKALASETGVTVEEVIKQALEHGIVGLREAQFFRLRRGKGNVAEALALLRQAGAGNPPLPGDEIPDDVKALYPELQDR
jgi:hypothetical protein